jgi:protein ImuB
MRRIACIRWKSGNGQGKSPIDNCKLRIANCKLQIVLERCRRFSPLIGLEPTDGESVLLDITGLAHLFGGEAALGEAIAGDLNQLGLAVRVAVADTVGAAWAAARWGERREGGREKGEGGRLKLELAPHSHAEHGNQDNLPSPFSPLPSPFIIPPGETLAFLAPLPVPALRLPPETVRLLGELGLRRIGQVEALAHEELASRFGPLLLRRLDQAFGRLNEPVRPCRFATKFAAHWSAEWPTARRDTIDAAVEHLIGRVATMLKDCGQGALRLECRLDLEIDSQQSTIRHQQLSVGLFRPTAAAKRLFELVEIQLERLRIAAPVADIHVAVTLTAPLEPPEQVMLFDSDDDRRQPRQLAALVERLGSRLGREAVAAVRLRTEAQPELAWHYDPLLGGMRRKVVRTRRVRNQHAERAEYDGDRHTACAAYNVPPRPLRLLPRPLVLAVTSIVPDGPPIAFRHGGQEHRIAHTWGPERIETGWWRGHAVGRDYFRVETATGCRFWLFRRLRDGKWFLHGSFD